MVISFQNVLNIGTQLTPSKLNKFFKMLGVKGTSKPTHDAAEENLNWLSPYFSPIFFREAMLLSRNDARTNMTRWPRFPCPENGLYRVMYQPHGDVGISWVAQEPNEDVVKLLNEMTNTV